MSLENGIKNIFLKGIINIYDDPIECFNDSLIIPNSRIISLDEDDSTIELSSILNPSVLKGTILLPPMEALWAESDGNEQAFNDHYYRYLMENVVVEFISTIISYLYNGGSVLIYVPSLTSIHTIFLYKFLLQAYGLDLGIKGTKPFMFDPQCIPIYLISMYNLGTISPEDFLSQFPIEIPIPDMMYVKLILDLQPYSEYDRDVISKKNSIDFLRVAMKNSGRVLHSVIHTIQ